METNIFSTIAVAFLTQLYLYSIYFATFIWTTYHNLLIEMATRNPRLPLLPGYGTNPMVIKKTIYYFTI